MPTILYLLASSPALNKPKPLTILSKFIPFNFNFHFIFQQGVRCAGIKKIADISAVTQCGGKPGQNIPLFDY